MYFTGENHKPLHGGQHAGKGAVPLAKMNYISAIVGILVIPGHGGVATRGWTWIGSCYAFTISFQ